jgi:hypothetical protein
VYGQENWTVSLAADGAGGKTLQARFNGQIMNLTALADVAEEEHVLRPYYHNHQHSSSSSAARGHGDGANQLSRSDLEGIFQAHPAGTDDAQLACRWLDDGVDEELVYFDVSPDEPEEESVGGEPGPGPQDSSRTADKAIQAKSFRAKSVQAKSVAFMGHKMLRKTAH